MKLILDEGVVIGGLSVNVMHDNVHKRPYIVVENDEGDLVIMEIKEKPKGGVS